MVQLDCPENANEYIHRAGRTARYQKEGESLLVLLPNEVKMVEHLEKKKIPIQEIRSVHIILPNNLGNKIFVKLFRLICLHVQSLDMSVV